MYAIVEFAACTSVAIIPTSWLCSAEEDECYWPSSQKASLHRLVMSREAPQDSWPRFRIRILGKAATYERAREKQSLAEETSDLQTDAETEDQPRKKRKNARYVSSDDESDDSIEERPSLSKSKTPSTPRSQALHRLPLPPPLQSARPGTSKRPASQQRRPSPTSRTLPLPPLPTLPNPRPTTSGSPGPSRPLQHRTPPSSGSTSPSVGSADDVDLFLTQTPSERRTPTPPLSDRASLQKLFTVLEDMRETQRIQGAMMRTILAKLNGKTSDATLELPDGVSFPLQSVAELNAMEERLATDAGFQTGLASLLADLGGRNVDEFIKRAMGYIMVTDLALKVNLIGRNQKVAFGKMRLFNVVHKALKTNDATSSCNRQAAEKAVSKWLSGARDRDGQRNLRRAAPAQPPQDREQPQDQ